MAEVVCRSTTLPPLRLATYKHGLPMFIRFSTFCFGSTLYSPKPPSTPVNPRQPPTLYPWLQPSHRQVKKVAKGCADASIATAVEAAGGQARGKSYDFIS